MITVSVVLVFISVVSTEHSALYKSSLSSFTSDLYKEYARTNNGNFLLCPFPAHTVLSLAAVGGTGDTLKELSEALHLPADVQNIQNIFQNLSEFVEATESYQLVSANKIYVKKSIEISQEYNKTARTIFKVCAENIDFAKADEATAIINEWVANKTNKKIKNLIKENALDPSTFLVLVNALYFQGYWQHAFDKSYYNKFHVSKTEVVATDTMFQRNLFNYSEDDSLNTKFLEIPFQGDDIVMIIALPNEIDGLANLERNLSKVLAADKFFAKDVMAYIPQFKIESDVDLKSLLQSLGVSQAFTTSANFHGISNTPVHIDQVVQKTFLEITEKGAIAASGTGMAVIAHSGPEAFFVADHPFLFYLKHKFYGVIFVGRLCKPNNLV